MNSRTASKLLLLCALAAPLGTAGAQRIVRSLNAGWRYHEGGINLAEKPANSDEGWQQVNLPHTWNAVDPFDDMPSYRRDIGWYRTRLPLEEALKGKRIFLHFEGANQVADVFVNNAFVGRHLGGYTAFTFDVTSYVKFGASAENVVAVQVNNAHDPFIAPLSVGFALYGGIYRDVWMIATDPVHFTMSDHGSAGITVTMPQVSRERARVRVSGVVEDHAPLGSHATLNTALLDATGRVVGGTGQSAFGGAVPRREFTLDLPEVENPHLWSPSDPYLYTLHVDLTVDGIVRDRITTRVGFRWYRFDPKTGFSLNGAKLQLKGTNRHQDYAGIGSALSNELHIKDMELIKEMGANFVRLAHYPQDPAVLEAADRLGLLLWEEVPVVNYITPGTEFRHNSEEMLREMIRQHRNHPSVIMWGIMNEVFLWGPGGYRIGKQNDTVYTRQVRLFADSMNAVAHAEDATRVSAMAMHMSGDYDSTGVATITDVLGLNIYNGWYSGAYTELGTVLDRRHNRFPDRTLFISEYGAEDDYRVNSLEPERFDFSGTWMRRFHEAYLAQINARPWLAGSAIWNEFDFSQPETGGSIPYMNQKGMFTFDRKPKDVFYLYKANWNPAPMVYIASRGWPNRIGTDRSPAQPLDVYSNLPRVELFLNGRSLGTQTPDSIHRATWTLPLAPGRNVVEARGMRDGVAYSDRMELQYRFQPSRLVDAAVPFHELGINVGGKAQYADAEGIWIGDQPYVAGSFGFVGGTPTIFDKDLAITNSAQTPLYFTYQSGLTAYRLDVPDGDYDLSLMFAEPTAKPGERVFGVAVNDAMVAERLDLAATHGLARAATYTVRATASGGAGLTVRFTPIQGQPILNAIHVRKR